MEKSDYDHWENSMHYWSPEAKGEEVEASKDPKRKGVLRRMGEKAMGMLQGVRERRERGGLIRDLGECMEMKRRPGAVMEDVALSMDKEMVFGVFDGAGGERGAIRASSLAAEAARGYLSQSEVDLTRVDMMKGALNYANRVVTEDGEAGYSTGVLGKIFRKEDGGIRMVWSSVGDSRIYVVRGGVAYRLTEDEAVGRRITNALGDRAGEARQGSKVELLEGDRVVMVSDGVTGDEGGVSWEEGGQMMPDGVVGRIVGGAESATDAARALVLTARKNDDRTALVIGV